MLSIAIGKYMNISAYGRVPFQGKKEHLNFLDAHYGENYDWVVTGLEVGRPGFVKIRN